MVHQKSKIKNVKAIHNTTSNLTLHVYLKSKKKMRQCTYLLCLFLFSMQSFSQEAKKPNSLEIYEAIQKLNFFGNVMYVAAHPDDENTRLITYFSKHYHAHTSYFSFTRGDGGQNLIGPELNEKLGLIRTQELLEARKIDGGHQFFSRAIDFGFSKNPEETLAVWNKDKVLADLVFAIRMNKPDIVINRFDHRTPGTTHGHHTASAMLSMQAFDLAGQPTAFPEQLNLVEVWQPKAIYFNDSWFFYRNKEEFKNAEHQNHVAINIGEYYADVGLSNNEIAALSRSMHKSQGFGNTGTRGDEIEYLELLKGDKASADNLFGEIETTWKRMKHPKAKNLHQLLQAVEHEFDFQQPHLSLPQLLKAYTMLSSIENSFWKQRKINELKQIILACTGLFIEAKTAIPYSIPGKSVDVNIEATNQSETNIQLKSVSILGEKSEDISQVDLIRNQKNEWKTTIKINDNQELSTPFWLKNYPNGALYQIEDIAKRNLPELNFTLPVEFHLDINNQTLTYTKNLVYKYNDPVDGEVYEDFQILPPVSVSFENKNLVFSNSTPKEVDVTITNFSEAQNYTLTIETDRNWQVEPASFSLAFSYPNETQTLQLLVSPPANSSSFELTAKVKSGGKTYSDKVVDIAYPHIPKQVLLEPNRLNLIKLDIKKQGNKVGYIEGAGDEVPKAIAEIGYEVDVFSVQDISAEKLSNYDAVVVGIRAFNIFEEFKIKKQALFNYAENGGNVIVQYQTSRGLKTELSPLPLEMSRNRVTDETAKVDFLAPQHPVLNIPNTITSSDFDHWVQERGLYFPENWSSDFTPILGMQDPNESVQHGSLLVAQYGEGYFTYTGLSLFRQLPAGVEGAYRLLANLLSLGNEKE